jgi:hypothetical protein
MSKLVNDQTHERKNVNASIRYIVAYSIFFLALFVVLLSLEMILIARYDSGVFIACLVIAAIGSGITMFQVAMSLYYSEYKVAAKNSALGNSILMRTPYTLILLFLNALQTIFISIAYDVVSARNVLLQLSIACSAFGMCVMLLQWILASCAWAADDNEALDMLQNSDASV